MNSNHTNAPKVVLSPAELALAQNADIILTKNALIDKVYHLFGQLAGLYAQASLPQPLRQAEICGANPKISRGEKYEELPWVMLDYPRAFNHQRGCFAIRTFFWWGHGFSIRGQFTKEWAAKAAATIARQQGIVNTWHTGWTHDPWNLRLPNELWLAYNHQVEDHPWLMLAQGNPINYWHNIEKAYPGAFQTLLNLFE